MSMPTALSAFLARNRFSLPISCWAAAAFMGVYQAELNAPSAASVGEVEVVVSKIGVLQVNVKGTRGEAVVATRQAGYAMEYRLRDQAFPANHLQPYRRQFASELDLTEAETHYIGQHGPNYRIRLIRDEIVSVASMSKTLIPYERYQASANQKRNLWRLYCALALVLGVVLFVAGHRQHRHAAA